MSNEHLMSAFEDADNDWTDDRQMSTHSGGLLNSLSSPHPAANDAVFGNLLAKGDEPTTSQPSDNETAPSDHPPTYEEAASDIAPSYWETTIMASGWCDDVLVDELPVGSHVQLIWNLLFSFAFGIGGFMGTYLVHASHAAKAGSILGLALTIIQSNYDSTPSTGTSPWNQDPNEFRPDHPNSYDETHIQTGTVQSGSHQPDAPTVAVPEGTGISWVSLVFAIFLVYWAVTGYIRAYRIKRAVLQGSDETALREAGEVDTNDHSDHQGNATATFNADAPPYDPPASQSTDQSPNHNETGPSDTLLSRQSIV